MNLSHSGLSGQLPGAWGGELSLPALRTLDLSGNGLQGALFLSPALHLFSRLPSRLPYLIPLSAPLPFCLPYPKLLSAPPILSTLWRCSRTATC